MTDNYEWRRNFHLPVLAVLQIVFIILFSQLVVYDPETVVGHEADANNKALEAIAAYPSESSLIHNRHKFPKVHSAFWTH